MKKNSADVFLIGAGDLGGWVTEIVSRLPGMENTSIVLADYDEEAARKRAFSAWAGTSLCNLAPTMAFEKINLFHLDETGELLKKYNPRVIVNLTSLQSWWVIIHELPEAIWNKIEVDVGIGPWEPMHLTLTYNLMQTINEYELDSHVVNCSFPDLTNHVLHKIGLGPTCGIGNGDLLVPGIKREVCKKLNISPQSVAVYLIAHHSHVMQFMITGRPGSPYYLKIMVGDKNVSDEFNHDELIVAGLKDWFPGRHCHPLVASSVARNIWHLLFDKGEISSCVPGPNGELGGYPARITPKGANIEIPEEITMEDAREINRVAQKKDGVERVKEDGTIVFTDQAHQIMKETLNYDCKELKISESKERYKELAEKYNALKKRHSC